MNILLYQCFHVPRLRALKSSLPLLFVLGSFSFFSPNQVFFIRTARNISEQLQSALLRGKFMDSFVFSSALFFAFSLHRVTRNLHSGILALIELSAAAAVGCALQNITVPIAPSITLAHISFKEIVNPCQRLPS